MENENEDTVDILGKKIFFLYPSAVVQNQIIPQLVQQEFEVYIVRDHSGLRRILKENPNSVVFVNLYDGIQEKEWETWIQGIMQDPLTSAVAIGILVTTEDETLKRKYLTVLKISAEYTVVKSDLSLSLRQVLDVLKGVDAKGRRKYLRAIIENTGSATVNVPLNGQFINGVVKDISVVGFSCVFERDQELTKNSLFQDIQLRLQSQLLKAEGIVFGSRMDDEAKTYVVLFTQRTDPDVKVRIRKFIQQQFQNKMDTQLR